MKNFKQLLVWQKSMDVVTAIYELAACFPAEEKFALSSQMRRASLSIPSNIAEGSGRGTDKNLKQFLEIALGSSFELETQLIVSERIYSKFQVQIDRLLKQIDEIQKMLIAFINTVK